MEGALARVQPCSAITVGIWIVVSTASDDGDGGGCGTMVMVVVVEWLLFKEEELTNLDKQ